MTDQDSLRQGIKERLRQLLELADQTSHDDLSRGLTTLATSYRAAVLKGPLSAGFRMVVQAGPFAGMRLIERVSEGCFLPKLMGTYEAPLHPALETAIGSGYDAVLNIGCAEGFYAVGMARRMPPRTRIHAFDIDPRAREFCRELAVLNGVEDRVEIAGRFDGADFAAFAGKRVLVLCDAEGAEIELLDPARFPALARMDVIVELHDQAEPKASAVVPERFRPSHDVTLLHGLPRRIDLPPRFASLREIDQLLLAFEARSIPTPWAVMTAR